MLRKVKPTSDSYRMFLEVKPNGKFDETTEKAVLEFQTHFASKFNLRPTGKVDAKTAEMLHIMSTEEGPILGKKTTLGEGPDNSGKYDNEPKAYEDAKAWDEFDGKLLEEEQEEQRLRQAGTRTEDGT